MVLIMLSDEELKKLLSNRTDEATAFILVALPVQLLPQTDIALALLPLPLDPQLLPYFVRVKNLYCSITTFRQNYIPVLYVSL